MARKQRKPGWFDQARKGESAFGANVMDPGSNIESEEKIVKSADGTVTKTTVSNKQNTPAFQGMQTEQTQGGVEKEAQKSYSPEQISAFDQSNMGVGDTDSFGNPINTDFAGNQVPYEMDADIRAAQMNRNAGFDDSWGNIVSENPPEAGPFGTSFSGGATQADYENRSLFERIADNNANQPGDVYTGGMTDQWGEPIVPQGPVGTSFSGGATQADYEATQAGNPSAAYTPEELAALKAKAIADSGVATYTRSDGSNAQAIPGSPEALGLEAMGYAEGGVGAASLLNPGVTGTPVLDTQAQAQEQIIAQQGDQAAQAAFEANSGLGNTAITNQVAADEARVAAEQSTISDFEVTNDPTLAQAQVEAQAEVQAKAQAEIDALDEAEANAPDDSGDMGGYDNPETQAQLDQANKDIQDKLAAGEDPKSMIDDISKWYGDNPVLAKALIGAVANYVATGNVYSALGAGLEGGAGALDSIAAGKAETAKEAKALKTWFLKDNYNHAQALQLQDRKINSTTASDAVKAEAEKTKAELTYSKDLTSRLEGNFDKETLRRFFPAGMRGEVSGGLKFVRDSLGVDVSNPDLATDEAMGIGMKRYMDHLERNPEQKGKAKFKTFFADAVIQRRAVDRGVDAGLFIDANGKSNPESAMKAYKTIQAKARKFDGNTEETWRALQTAFLEFKATDNYDTMVGLAEKKDVPPFIYFINHEVNLVE